MDQFLQAAKEVSGGNTSIILFGAFVIVGLCYAINVIWKSYDSIVNKEVDKE